MGVFLWEGRKARGACAAGGWEWGVHGEGFKVDRGGEESLGSDGACMGDKRR